MLDINRSTPNPVPWQQISILKNKPLHNLVDSNRQGQERCNGTTTCKLTTTLTYTHPHHCNSAANVLERASSCQRGSALLGSCRENCSPSLHNECKQGKGEHQCFHGSTSHCAASRWKNELHSFWQYGQLKQLQPPLLALHSSFPPPKHSLQQCQNNCLMGLDAGLHLSPVKNNPAPKRALTALLSQRRTQPRSQQLQEARQKGGHGKGTVSQQSHQQSHFQTML